MNLEFGIVLLKWISQALIAVVGVWGLISDPFEKDPATGKRRLNRAGWLKIALLAIGFFLFALTDVDERRSSRAQQERQAHQIEMQRKTVEAQETQLAYLRRLILLQYRMSEIGLLLEFPEPFMNRMRSSIQSYKPKSPQVKIDKTQLAYIATALSVGTAVVRFDGNGHGELQYSLNRHQGPTGGRVSEPDGEWRSFRAAFRALFGERFEIQSESGRTLIDLLNPTSRTEVTFGGNSVSINMRDPEVRLDELNGSLMFVCGKDALLFVIEDVFGGDEKGQPKTPKKIGFGPLKARLTSRDPRVEWNQEIPLEWNPVVLRTVEESEERISELGEWHSSPVPVNATFSKLGLE